MRTILLTASLALGILATSVLAQQSIPQHPCSCGTLAASLIDQNDDAVEAYLKTCQIDTPKKAIWRVWGCLIETLPKLPVEPPVKK